MSAPGPIDLVCFDLGGVLVRIRTDWVEQCRALGLDVRGDAAGELAQRARRAITEAHMLGQVGIEGWVLEVGRALGGLYTPAEIKALHDAIIIDEYPGVATLIDDLHRADIATACLSNTNDAHWAALLHHDGAKALPGAPRYGGVRRLGSHYASHLMGLTKPNPEIYRAFEKATGRHGSQILFFDDLAENIAAARAVGWHAESVDPSQGTSEQMRAHLAAYGLLAS
jgi:putative hydrolase of the HAD superfamily